MEKENIKVAAVVVTYNRLEFLKDCVDALKHQTYKNMDIVIVNNGSTDGTSEWLSTNTNIVVINQENCGGAGGFFSGMKYMFEHDYEALWMMDDDGLPAKNQLEQLIAISDKYHVDYANALVLNRDNKHLMCSGGEYNPKDYENIEFIPNVVLPFNGTFIKRHVIEKIGFIKKEMFIWGDEREYTARVKHAGFKIGTITSAIHYHPAFKGDLRNMIPLCNKWKVAFKPSPRDKIFFRNLGYIDYKYGTKHFLKYLIYYITHLQFIRIPYLIKYIRMGRNDDFTTKLL